MPRIGPDVAGYRAFYVALMGEIRARGLRVGVEMGTTFDEVFSDVVFDYRGQPYAVLRDDLRAQAQWIATELRPDTLSLINEPDTQQKNTGIAFTSELWADLVDHAARGVRVVAPALALGAGTGSWNAARYAAALLALPALDFYDVHVYPLQYGWAATALDVLARDTRSAGKALAVGEAWLYKANAGELAGDIAAAADVFARDVFAFWQPLDIAFLRLAGAFARAAGPAFFSFFWTRSFYGALDWDATTQNLPPGELFRRLAAIAGANVARDAPNAVGLAAADLIAGRLQ